MSCLNKINPRSFSNRFTWISYSLTPTPFTLSFYLFLSNILYCAPIFHSLSLSLSVSYSCSLSHPFSLTLSHTLLPPLSLSISPTLAGFYHPRSVCYPFSHSCSLSHPLSLHSGFYLRLLSLSLSLSLSLDPLFPLDLSHPLSRRLSPFLFFFLPLSPNSLSLSHASSLAPPPLPPLYPFIFGL